MKRYTYVGPAEIRAAIGPQSGTAIGSIDDLRRWLAAHALEREEGAIPATFVVSIDGTLRLASRRSEHVACAGGADVLAAGEIFFASDRVTAVSNQSTGYCPEPESWPAVASALERAGIAHPQRFTRELVFRRCPACGERNIVKDDFFGCAICDAPLPAAWNFA